MTTIKKNEWTGITKVEIFCYQADSDVFYDDVKWCPDTERIHLFKSGTTIHTVICDYVSVKLENPTLMRINRSECETFVNIPEGYYTKFLNRHPDTLYVE